MLENYSSRRNQRRNVYRTGNEQQNIDGPKFAQGNEVVSGKNGKKFREIDSRLYIFDTKDMEKMITYLLDTHF